jgi:hypothetical protein
MTTLLAPQPNSVAAIASNRRLRIMRLNFSVAELQSGRISMALQLVIPKKKPKLRH